MNSWMKNRIMMILCMRAYVIFHAFQIAESATRSFISITLFFFTCINNHSHREHRDERSYPQNACYKGWDKRGKIYSDTSEECIASFTSWCTRKDGGRDIKGSFFFLALVGIRTFWKSYHSMKGVNCIIYESFFSKTKEYAIFHIYYWWLLHSNIIHTEWLWLDHPDRSH